MESLNQFVGQRALCNIPRVNLSLHSNPRAGKVSVGRSCITSVLSERPLRLADQKMERGKMLNPEYSICRDQPTSQASPLRINDLLSRVIPEQRHIYLSETASRRTKHPYNPCVLRSHLEHPSNHPET